MSEGCNAMIRDNKAALIENARDIEYLMRWDKSLENTRPCQSSLFIDLLPDEEKIVNVLKIEDKLGLDMLSIKTGLSVSKVSSTLLGLEFKGVIHVSPGNLIKLN